MSNNTSKSPVSKTWNSNTTSFLASLCAFISVTFYIWYRQDFDTPILPVLTTAGVSLFVLNSPTFLSRLNYFNRGWLSDTTVMTFGALVVVLLFGGLNFVIGIPFGLILSIIGFLFFAYNVYFIVSLKRQSGLFWCILSVIIFGCYALFKFYVSHLTPLSFENLKANVVPFPPDFQFHVAILQMILNYGVPSTGLDGVPFFYYHYGTHYIFASLVKLLDLKAADAYLIVYPVIFIPFFLKVMIDFSASICRVVFKKTLELNMLYFIILLFLFLEILNNVHPGTLLGRASMYVPIIFISESFNISLSFLFVMFSSILTAYGEERPLSRKDENIYLFVYLPILTAFIGFSKISTIPVVIAVLGYAIIRVSGMKGRLLTAFVIYAVILVGAFFLTNNPKDAEGGLYPFYFLTKSVRLPFYKFFPVYFYWLLSATLLILLYHDVKSIKHMVLLFRQKKLLAIEFLWLIAAVGLLPGSLLDFSSHDNSIYFSEIHKWVSGCFALASITILFQTPASPSREKAYYLIPIFVLACLPSAYVFITQSMDKQFFTILVPLIILFLWKKGFITGKISIRAALVISVLPFFFNAFINLKTSASYFDTMRSNLIAGLIESHLHPTPGQKFMEQIVAMDTVKDKRNTLLYVRNYINYIQQYSATHGPLSIPALSGYALLNGNPPCNIGFDCSGYGYEYYEKISAEQMIKFDEKDLIRETDSLGFHELIVVDFRSSHIESIR